MTLSTQCVPCTIRKIVLYVNFLIVIVIWVHLEFMRCYQWAKKLWNMGIIDRSKPRLKPTLIARFKGLTWGPSGPTGPRWAPCWPHELCYLGTKRQCAHIFLDVPCTTTLYSALLCVIAELQLYFMISLHNISMFNPCTTHKWHDEEPIPRVWRLAGSCGKSKRVKTKSADERATCFLKQLQSFQRRNYKRVRCVQWSLRLIYNNVHYRHTQWDMSPVNYCWGQYPCTLPCGQVSEMHLEIGNLGSNLIWKQIPESTNLPNICFMRTSFGAISHSDVFWLSIVLYPSGFVDIWCNNISNIGEWYYIIGMCGGQHLSLVYRMISNGLLRGEYLWQIKFSHIHGE